MDETITEPENGPVSDPEIRTEPVTEQEWQEELQKHDEPGAPPPEALERAVLHRDLSVELSEGDGRTIDARVVPYNQPAQVADPPFFVPYMEEFLPGAFDNQVRAASRVKVLLNFEHEPGIGGVVGHGVSLRDEGGFLHGSFRVHDNADGDKALEMVRDGILTGMSVEFEPLRSRSSEKGIVQRIKAKLDKVALCRFPAYKGAEVLAVRTEPVKHEIEVPVADPEITDRLSALGVVPLNRVSVTNKPWDPSTDRFTDDEYEASCLIDYQTDGGPKQRCGLPVLEPDGTINVNALDQAVNTLQWKRTALQRATLTQRQTAARTAMRYLRLAQLEIPAALRTLAAGRSFTPSSTMKRAITKRPWDGSPSRFTDEQYQRSCLIDRGGDAPVKERCSLPVLEPDGTLNVNALGAAAAALAGGRTPLANVSMPMKQAAARKLMRYYRMAGMTPPSSLTQLAG